MHRVTFRRARVVAGFVAAVVIAGCATQPPPAPEPEAQPPACQAAAENDALTGNWLSVRRQKGVNGELRTLFTLNQDGTMAYTELLKRGKNPSQGLSETGCWSRIKGALVLQTLLSNGAPVSMDDPIYKNSYIVEASGGDSLTLRNEEGARIKARRMSPGYRLPF
ncbi:hypothetical protein [Pusillimonas sp. ANT_WB101]|uniref:hypothetical protein n=1 Tax=Pusillimonas sp. ANT_WB101 TaxID=2597356 RepID=UPI0011F054E1|nr:hypothetical protein [Pusillimonas sp. ANT_WB101]KAA0889212.1 hypothetical protein FQ179_18695 [Pusillimonas sp. ANT_WB101]NYT78773.1 hypothetical protein [Alcaligenaceae bacterium]